MKLQDSFQQILLSRLQAALIHRHLSNTQTVRWKWADYGKVWHLGMLTHLYILADDGRSAHAPV